MKVPQIPPIPGMTALGISDNYKSAFQRDHKCQNSEPGWYNQECGKPAEWLGIKLSGFRADFCDDCKRRGAERHGFTFTKLTKGEDNETEPDQIKHD